MAKSVPQIDGDAVEELPLVVLEEQVHVQRATTSSIVPVRTLGTGAFGQVDLVSIPVAGERKLLVRKMLVPGSNCSSLNGTAMQAAMPKEAAKFFAGCVLMALQWMHSRRILHRDIKPCNLLLFDDGYLKLADMGCCCQLPPGIDAAQTRTGTAAYMAPEVASGAQAYSYPVDMWSLGITIWQMELCDLLSGLLHHDSAARMRVEDVMGADWFDGFDWQGLRDKTLTPPALEAPGQHLQAQAGRQRGSAVSTWVLSRGRQEARCCRPFEAAGAQCACAHCSLSRGYVSQHQRRLLAGEQGHIGNTVSRC
ncbi:kinase-like domain-containing protein [Scenedesmus sp. NREL 46B-D3]|nr:kinase-like domain-containing protein [Scenedesmus sp. NREL 46B-D3]